jgi:hypothetical protein
MKNTVFWDITPCETCKNRSFEEIIAYIIRVAKLGELGTGITLLLYVNDVHTSQETNLWAFTAC